MEMGQGTGALSLSPWMTKAIIRSGDPIPWTGNNVETNLLISVELVLSYAGTKF